MKNLITEKKEYLLIIIYFIFLLPFYMNNWVVPDFVVYTSWAQSGVMGVDGYSALFILISGFATIAPRLIRIICLFLLCFSIYSMIYFYRVIVCQVINNFYKNIVLCVVFSNGIWYYFYGKVFYDYPFLIGNFGLCLMLIVKVYQTYYKNKKIDYKIYYLAFSIGLCISWKIHSIFLIFGTFLIILCNDDWRKLFLDILSSINILVKSILFIVIGYIMGNYGLIFDFIKTIKQISGYPAKSDIFKRTFDMDFIVWDHVNLMPWNISVMSIFTCIWIGILMPIIIKKYRYVFVSCFIIIIFGVISSTKSYGYTWQAFPVGAFFIILFLFLLLEFDTISLKRKKIFLLGSLGVFGFQLLITFGFYIPKQIQWHKNTENSIECLIENEEQIRNDTQELINWIGNNNFSINIAVKRFIPVQFNPIYLNKISKSNPYISSINRQFVDPLNYANLDVWNEIYDLPNYREYLSGKYEYMIYIIPNKFKIMNDVANISIYLNASSIISYDRKDYSIRLIKMEGDK